MFFTGPLWSSSWYKTVVILECDGTEKSGQHNPGGLIDWEIDMEFSVCLAWLLLCWMEGVGSSLPLISVPSPKGTGSTG